MKKFIILLLFTSCASALKPANERSFSIKRENGKSFQEVKKYLSLNIDRPDKAIKYENENLGELILNSSVTCNVFRQLGDIQDYNLKFSLVLSPKELIFENLFISYDTGEPVKWEYNQISSPEKLEKSKECLQDFLRGL